MDMLQDLGLGILMAVVAFIVFDWGRGWWAYRRFGSVQVSPGGRLTGDPLEWHWRQAYPGYKAWTWLVRAATWAIAAWHAVLAWCWFVDIAFNLFTS